MVIYFDLAVFFEVIVCRIVKSRQHKYSCMENGRSSYDAQASAAELKLATLI